MAKKMTAQTASIKPGSNGYNDKALSYVERVEVLQAEIDAKMAAAKKECQIQVTDIKQVKKEAKSELGVNAAVLNAHLQRRKHERNAENVRNKLNENLQDGYDDFQLAIGDLADTPLGDAAAPAKTAQFEQGSQAGSNATH